MILVRSEANSVIRSCRSVRCSDPFVGHGNGKINDRCLNRWLRALALRDRETAGHSRRVTQMTVQLCRAMRFDDAELLSMRWGAMLHDIGKLYIPSRILRKPDVLNEAEWEIMRRHPVYGLQLLSSVRMPQCVLDITYHHHERWNGTGYPEGLQGTDIPLPARIFAVVDVWDALRSNRPYRSAWSEERVREYIRERAGDHFDPDVVQVFLQVTSYLLQ